jgi:hypothetical protein
MDLTDEEGLTLLVIFFLLLLLRAMPVCEELKGFFVSSNLV